MRRIAEYAWVMLLSLLLPHLASGQDFINQEEALAWIGSHIEIYTTVPLRYQTSATNYTFEENDHRFFRLTAINGCKMILERYDQVDGKPLIKSVYEVHMDEIDPDNIRMSVEKYSRNICLLLIPENNRKIKVTRMSGKDYRYRQIRKKDKVVIEFNYEAYRHNIPLQMQKAFQYAIQKCSYNSSILNYIESMY